MGLFQNVRCTETCLLESYKSLLPEVMEITPFGRGNQIRLCKFPRNASFYLSPLEISVVQLELISRYLICLLEFGELGFPLDLTVGTSLYGTDDMKSFLGVPCIFKKVLLKGIKAGPFCPPFFL